MENKTELISCTRPVKESVLQVQCRNLAVIRSTRPLQSTTFSLDEIRGTPKYFIGISPSLNPRILIIYSLSTPNGPLKKMSLLFGFGYRPDRTWNSVSTFLIIRIECTSPLLNIIKSSAKQRWEILSFLHLQWNLKFWLALILQNSPDRISMHRTNKYGDNGSPCLSPLPPWK